MRGFARESARSKGKGRKRGLNRDPSYLLTSRPACFHNGGTTLSLILVHDSGSNVRISRNKEEIKSIEKASIIFNSIYLLAGFKLPAGIMQMRPRSQLSKGWRRGTTKAAVSFNSQGNFHRKTIRPLCARGGNSKEGTGFISSRAKEIILKNKISIRKNANENNLNKRHSISSPNSVLIILP